METYFLTYGLPAIGLAILLVLAYLVRTTRRATFTGNYHADRFRQQLEMQVAQLSDRLAWSETRFRDLNHLLLEAQSGQPRGGSPGRSGDFAARVGFDATVPVDSKLVFVLTPFNQAYDRDYAAIKNAIQDLGFTCRRGDEEYRSGAILPYILQEIVRARVVIANISGRNPNVFYELGIAHALGKNVVIVARSDEAIPFDVAEKRVFVYDDEHDLQAGIRNWLVHSLADHDVPY